MTVPDRTGRILHAGRHLGWTEWGAADGAPVLFCTGAGMAGSLGFGAAVLRSSGLRLICVDRAGLGLSAPDPAKSYSRYAADVAAVLRSLGIAGPVPVIGFSQGAAFAVALAGEGLASSLALVSGQDDFTHPATRPLLHPEIERLVGAIEEDPAAVEAMLAPHVDAEGMWSLVMGASSERDRAFFETPEFATAYRRSLAEGFAQGPAGYLRDLTLAMGRWPHPPETIRVPVQLWYGGLDTSPSHSPDRGATLARRFPSATLHLLADEGSALLWTRSADVLRSCQVNAARRR